MLHLTKTFFLIDLHLKFKLRFAEDLHPIKIFAHTKVGKRKQFEALYASPIPRMSSDLHLLLVKWTNTFQIHPLPMLFLAPSHFHCSVILSLRCFYLLIYSLSLGKPSSMWGPKFCFKFNLALLEITPTIAIHLNKGQSGRVAVYLVLNIKLKCKCISKSQDQKLQNC